MRLIGRNLPLTLMLGAIGMLFWPKFEDAALTEPEEITPQAKSFTSSRAPGEVHV